MILFANFFDFETARWSWSRSAHYFAGVSDVVNAQVAWAGENWTVRREVIVLAALSRILDEVEDATKVWTDATVSNNIIIRQLDDVAWNLAYFFAFWVVFDIALFEHERQTCPRFREVAVLESWHRRLSNWLVRFAENI